MRGSERGTIRREYRTLAGFRKAWNAAQASGRLIHWFATDHARVLVLRATDARKGGGE